MNVPGPRPHTQPVHHGKFEPMHVYMRGDTVTWEGEAYEALADGRSGFLPPPICETDHPSVYWVRLSPLRRRLRGIDVGYPH